jgi:predicted dehydrogenase
VHTAVNFTYRYVPAARFAREIIQNGDLGEIRHVITSYNQGRIVDPDVPHSWRLNKQIAGTGVLGDLGSHLIDLIRFWGTEFSAVNGHLKTFVHERPTLDGGTAPVDVDDAASITAEFAHGGTGVVFTSRFAFGRGNHNRAEIYGSKGALVYDNDHPTELGFCVGEFMGRHFQFNRIPVPRSILHAPTSTMQAFVEDLALDRRTTATFADGLAAQIVLDAVVESAESRQWVSIEQM